MRKLLSFLIAAVAIAIVYFATVWPKKESLPSAVAGRGPATIIADVVALDSLLVYNRFGSFNPFGMIYALREDVAPVNAPVAFDDAAKCSTLEAEVKSRAAPGMTLEAGRVRLRDCKRPRPLTLRANVGDTLEIHFQNLLADQPDISKSFCPTSFRDPPAGADNLNDVIWKDEFPNGAPPGRQHCGSREDAEKNAGQEAKNGKPSPLPAPDDWPKTRGANFAIAGLKLAATQFPRRQPGDPADAERFDPDICLGVSSAKRGERVVCRYEISHEGPFFASSTAAFAGGEGDGGSLTHGLFASVIAEPAKSAWYRSQVTSGVFDAVWPRNNASTNPHARAGALNYDGQDAETGLPYLNMLKAESTAGRPQLIHWDKQKAPQADAALLRLVHADLNAIIREPDKRAGAGTAQAYAPFREFTVMFHDEMKTYYADAYRLLGPADGDFTQLAGVRDGFGINYGAGGMGPILIANRKGIGPAADCVECLYEEFFLQSWANGDPALLEHFPDDPSNVHHSYLNDRVVFRNFHAGPKETHVFHLHAHQWFAGNDTGRGSYLDSQTVGPGQGFTYRIYQGGLNNYSKSGWFESHGAGNRNRSPGDSIFHCHLYPHFAQGMWELWRNHDVLEDGARKLPDGQHGAGLSLAPEKERGARKGTPLDATDRNSILSAAGTPIPAVVPLPDEPAPLLPTYGEKGMPGYPFYVAGEPGRRAPQPPLDMALDANGKPMDGGLPRHVVKSGARKFSAQDDVSAAPSADALLARSLAIGDFTAHPESLNLKLLDPAGEKFERNAMAFHHDGAVRENAGGAPRQLELAQANGAPSKFNPATGGYETFTLAAATASGAVQASAPGQFYVNGAPPRPGAPFADPCGAPDGLTGKAPVADPFLHDRAVFTPDPAVGGFRRYDVSAVQLKDMIVNKAGWHDPQARIDVLSAEADRYKDKVRADAAPFFFRARSGECIEFRHTNELPHWLERDDFQVATPTDTIGQHIHLVKFDVTASDGSGNGWNYEDGTFAPDEVKLRICASQPGKGSVEGVGRTDLHNRACDGSHEYWRESRAAHPEWFQTSVQRWFADPILSSKTLEGKPEVDRTMRTVFSHDHFGPSSIQQHGFYTALVIEPSNAAICPEHVDPSSKAQCDTTFATPGDPDKTLRIGDDRLVGPRKVVLNDRASHEADAREYALAVADFALLYDPHAPSGATQYKEESPAKGLVCLGREADEKAANQDAKVPASICSGRGAMEPGDSPIDMAGYSKRDLSVVAPMLAKAARDARDRHGRPIAPPDRPESISVDHHDPYLVNYRNEPPALRVGATRAGSTEGPSLAPCGDPNAARRAPERSIAFQREKDIGDLGLAFRSIVTVGEHAGMTHGDPCTPVLDVYDNEHIQIRLIQGAQEVQHVFTVEGFTFTRNYDQKFPAFRDFASQSDDAIQTPVWWRKCHQSRAATAGVIDAGNGDAHDRAAAICDNIDGREAAQEIGISEHFEFAAPLRREGVAQTPVAGARETFTPMSVSAPKKAKAAPRDLFADPVFANRVTATDYLYHFGTLDAIWNGAWGLMRVHEAPSKQRLAYDIAACLQAPSDDSASAVGCIKSTDRTMRERLTPLKEARAIVLPSDDSFADDAMAALQSMKAKEAALLRSSGKRARDAKAGSPSERPKPQFAVACPPGAPHVRATVAALEARDLNAKGIVYHPQTPQLRDPDGRLLALIASEALSADAGSAFSLTPNAMSRRNAIAAAKAALAGAPTTDELASRHIRPFILRINAGDCLDLTMVNLLSTSPKPGDAEGDALMPKITPLNVDTHDGWNTKTGEFHAGNSADASRNVRVSSKFALSVPLTATSNQATTPTPVGVDPGKSLAPGEAARVFYFAGTLEPKNFAKLDAALEAQFCRAPELEAARLKRFDPALHAPDDFIIDVLGRWYRLEGVAIGPDKRSALAECIREAIAKDLDAAKAFKPYAFGALPLKPLGDVFNQTPHGLFGALIVEPQGACYAGRRQPGACDNGVPGAGATSEDVEIVPEQMTESAAIRLTDDGARAGEPSAPPQNALREHVLIWQDGLNLWAQNATNEQPVADCHVCDDTYDFGKKGVNYRSTPLYARLNLRGENPFADASKPLNGAANYNAVDLGEGILHVRGAGADRTPIVLQAKAGEEELLRVVHPGGRARQRAFVLTGNGFDDLFPGFGFPNAALLAPGKAVTAATRRPLGPGCHLWRDGPNLMVGAGAWGLLEVTDQSGNGACPVSQPQSSPR